MIIIVIIFSILKYVSLLPTLVGDVSRLNLLVLELTSSGTKIYYVGHYLYRKTKGRGT